MRIETFFRRQNMQVRRNISLDEEVSKEIETMAKELGEKKEQNHRKSSYCLF